MTAWSMHLALNVNCETANEKLEIIILTDWSNSEGEGVIDIGALSAYCCMTVARTRHYLSQAVRHGFVQVTATNVEVPYLDDSVGFSYRVSVNEFGMAG